MKLEGNRFRVISRSFTAIVTRKAISIPEEGLVFNFGEISSMVINAKQTIELYCPGGVYRIRLEKGSSPLKIWELYMTMQARKENQ